MLSITTVQTHLAHQAKKTVIKFLSLDFTQVIRPSVIALIVLGLFGEVPNWFQSQIALGLMILCTFITADLFKKTDWTVSSLFFLSTVSAAFFAFWPHTPFLKYRQDVVLNMVMAASQSILFTVAVVVFVLYIIKDIDEWIKGFSYLAFVSSLYVIYNYFFAPIPVGVLNNCSMDSMFFGLLIPFIFYKKQYWMMPTITVALMLEFLLWRSTTGPIMIGLELMMWAYFTNQKKLLATMFLVGLAFIALLSKRFDIMMNGRQTVAALTFHTAKDLGHIFIGNGSGSFLAIMPSIQLEHNVHDIMLWAHNEYVQVYFEQGILALILLGILFLKLIYKSMNIPWLCITVVAMALASVSQMPFRLFPTALFFALITRKCFELNKEEPLNA